MKDEKKAPKLRFKGFTDDWEQRKLKDVLDISKTKNKAQQYGKVDVLSVSREVGTVNQIKYQGRSFAGSDLSNYKVVQGGELIYTKSPLKGAPYGIFQVATIKGIISPLYAVYTSTDKAYTPFVATALKNDNIATHYLTPLVTKGAKNTINVTDEGALEGKIQFPSILEQKQIFIFFKQLDDIIALHEEKKRQLERLKSALLQKMFADKSGYPDVRFKGFDERWERHVLNDLAIFNPKGTLPTSFEYVDLGSVIGVEMISHKTISKFDAPSRAQRLAQVGDLFYQTVRPYQQNNYLFDNKDNAYVFSTGYAQLRPLIDGYFLLCVVQTKSFVRKVMNACTGTSYPAINSQDLAQIGVNIPINSKEQRLIGKLYKVIDNLITLYQRKLDDLNTIKQSLLQKMFI